MLTDRLEGQVVQTLCGQVQLLKQHTVCPSRETAPTTYSARHHSYWIGMLVVRAVFLD